MQKIAIKRIIIVFLILYPAFTSFYIGSLFSSDNAFVGYLLSTPIMFLPMLACIGKNTFQKWIMTTIMIPGYTVGLVMTECCVRKSNLWPLSIFAVPVLLGPTLIMYFVIIGFIERCKSDPNLKW